MFPIPTLWIAVGAAVVVAALTGAVTVQTSRLHSAQAETKLVQAKFDGFVAKAKKLGDAQVAKAKAADEANIKLKEKSDAAHKKEVSRLAANWAAARAERDRLRGELASADSRPVSSVTVDPGLSCDAASNDAISAAVSGFIAGARQALAECRSAVGAFRESVAGQLEQADSNAAALSCGVEWAAGIR